MSHIHRRFTDEQVRVLFQGYCQGQLRRVDVQDLLGIGKSRFFARLKVYRQDPEGFSVAYQRQTRERCADGRQPPRSAPDLVYCGHRAQA